MKNSSYFSKSIKESPLNNAAHELYTVLKISQSLVSRVQKLIQSVPKAFCADEFISTLAQKYFINMHHKASNHCITCRVQQLP